MPISTSQKKTMISVAMGLARQFTNLNKAYKAFRDEWDAEDYGTLITTDVIAANSTSELTGAEFVDGVAAMGSVSSVIDMNKTNLYRLS